MQSKEIIIKLKNTEAKRLLEKTKLEYSQSILNILKDNPELYPQLLDHLEINEKELLLNLSGEYNENITFYDEALHKLNTLTKKKNNNH